MLVLGIDAAWTAGEPSGVALIQRQEPGVWTALAIAPSYATFNALAGGGAVDWLAPRFHGAAPNLGELHQSAMHLSGGQGVQVISADIPLSLVPIVGPRVADAVTGQAYGAFGCAPHSPNTERPGGISVAIRDAATQVGLHLATAGNAGGDANSLIETYPHPAILSLLGLNYRLPYKVSKTTKYWPGEDLYARRGRVLASLQHLLEGLQLEIAGIELPLPAEVGDGVTFRYLKRFEDCLDALVCAWVGARFLEGNAIAYGDDLAAIWVPNR